jgi:NAD(P)-dependent dehydrogenase (short-subunit alcohol dehydrogenase family)
MRRRVVVTGGFGVLGRAVVAALAEVGHAVAAVDLAPAVDIPGAAVAKGGVDLADPAAVEAAYKEVSGRLGGIDALVNIAGGFVWETVEGGRLESFDDMYRMNVRTSVVSSRAALAHLGEGSAIVNVGAAGAIRPGKGFAAYAASKAGVHALTESLANELKGKGIRVNAILPTTLDTPANRKEMPNTDPSAFVQPAAAAAVIAFLISDDARAVTGASVPLSCGG